MTKKIVYVSLILLSLFLISCSPENSIPATKQCHTDLDCIPAQCCHPTDAVNKQYSPDCSGTFCTTECQPETLDCGQGQVKCIAGICMAVLE